MKRQTTSAILRFVIATVINRIANRGFVLDIDVGLDRDIRLLFLFVFRLIERGDQLAGLLTGVLGVNITWHNNEKRQGGSKRYSEHEFLPWKMA